MNAKKYCPSSNYKKKCLRNNSLLIKQYDGCTRKNKEQLVGAWLRSTSGNSESSTRGMLLRRRGSVELGVLAVAEKYPHFVRNIGIWNKSRHFSLEPKILPANSQEVGEEAPHGVIPAERQTMPQSSRRGVAISWNRENQSFVRIFRAYRSWRVTPRKWKWPSGGWALNRPWRRYFLFENY